MLKILKHKYAIFTYAIALGIFGAILAYTNLEKIKGIISGTDPSFIYWALFYCAVSYFAHALSFLAAVIIFRIKIPAIEVLEIGFVSSVLSNMLSAAGIPGHSYRILTMRRRSVSAGDVTAASIFHSYFNGAIFFLLVPLAFFYFFSADVLMREEFAALAGVMVALLVLFLATTAALFSRKIREAALRIAVRIANAFRKSSRFELFLDSFNSATHKGIERSRKKPFQLFALVILLLIDWAAMVASLGYCFSAFGTPVNFEKLLLGFAAGTIAGTVSMIPGGLVIQEGSMAGTFLLLGLDLETAVLAAVLFRIVYYFVPLAASFVFFGKLMIKSGKNP